MKTIYELTKMLDEDLISSEQLCKDYFKSLDNSESKIKAFLSLDKDNILLQAKESDKRRIEGKSLSKFDGIPIAVKDNIAVKGEPCTCASKILAPFNSPYDATVITKLKKFGFITFGRTNMDEFAMGSSCENSAFAKTRNPKNTDHVPGGSSGGSAAAVAADFVPAALGSDTGGSIRQPASFCGVVGFKPTYGRVSRYGLVAYASSLDQIGPLTNTVQDAALLYDVISGYDAKDSTSLKTDKVQETANNLNLSNLENIKIGIPKEYFDQAGLDKGVRVQIDNSIKLLKKLGAKMVDISLPHSKYAVSAYYVIATAEASANLARFDGIRYGKRANDTKNVIETYLESRGQGFGDEVKRRILLGTFVLSSGYYDAYYLKAQKVRTLIRKDFSNALDNCDVILSPTSPLPAFKIGENSQDPLQMYLSDIYTISLNLVGGCGISLPCGTHTNGLPVGLQFMGAPMDELKLLQIAATFESALKQN